MRVYIAGPIARDPLGGTRAAILAASRLVDAGHAPYVPHLSVLWEIVSPRPYEDWIALGLAWVGQCEALIRLPGESPGADREVAEARRLGLPVYEGVQALLDAESSRLAAAVEAEDLPF